MLLITSILSALVAGFFGYRSGSEALRQGAYDQLTSVLDARTRAIESLYAGLARATLLNSQNGTVVPAVRELTREFRRLDRVPVTAAEREAVTAYYEDVFVPSLQENLGGEVSVQSFLPRSNAQWHLQAAYTAPNESFDDAIAVTDAGDGSGWSAAHARSHPFLREVAERNPFEDVFLLDTEGNVVYSAYKGVDLGTNILTGPFRDSALGRAYQEVLRTSTVDSYAVTDFERYTPSADAPSSFGLSPVGEDGRVTGVFVVQLPLDGIDRVMTTDGEWEAAGMGETGEAYLVGPDGTLRSTSRLLVEDPEGYEADVVEEGVSPDLAALIAESGNPVLRQSVDSGSVQQALKGQSGITTETDFHGHRVLTAYAPADIDGLNWAVIAQIDEDEALAPVTDFLRTLALSVLALVLLVTLASLVLAKAFSRPVMELLAGVRRVASGDLQARVDIRNRDEFADLAVAFNEMAASLSTKQDLLDAQLRENDRLLLTLMPRPVADRFRGGEQNIADEHHDVSVIFATVEGFDDFTAGKAPDEAIRLLNELYSRFESTAERSAVERVRTLRSGFIACSGLHVPRVDHATRIVDFAREMAETVARYNAQFDAALELRAGIDSGTVTTGLVGGSSLYDLWGDSVNLAFGVQSSAPEPGIYVTQAVHDLISDSQPLVAAGTLAVQGDERPVWRLDGDRGRHG